jgi:hypothetical protein
VFTCGNYYPETVTVSTHCVGQDWSYQTVGAGGFYLTNNSSYHNAGTTNISPALLAELRQKTTYAPAWLTNTITQDTNLTTTAPRDTNTSAVDLGYHYDPIDYLAAFRATNVTITLSNGVVLAGYPNTNTSPASNARLGVSLKNGSFISRGTVSTRNVYLNGVSLVQEQSTGSEDLFWKRMILGTLDIQQASQIDLQFTSFFVPCGNEGGISLNSTNLTMRNCENYFGPQTYCWVFSGKNCDIRNNVFIYPTYISLQGTNGCVFNNLFTGTESDDVWWDVSSSLTNCNNVFDGCRSYLRGTSSHNAYLNGAVILNQPLQTGDIVTNLTWVNGPLGAYYQPSNSALINAGLTNANLLGLYHFTTQTNQFKETNSVVDIGYHYVATDASGNPFDTDGDGLPDYIEDANGNGQVNLDETDWANPDSDYDGVGDGQEIADGTDPLNPDSVKGLLGRWHFNDTNWLGAQGQMPLVATNLQLAPGWSSNAMELDAAEGDLRYRLVETGGHTNLNLQCGSVRFWFSPNWSSTDQGGTGLDKYSCLVTVYRGPANWGLFFKTEGTALKLLASTNGNDVNLLDAAVPVISNQWYQIAVTYSPTNTALYTNGVLAASGDDFALIPASDDFEVGNYDSGYPALGRFDELETFDYPLSANQIALDYYNSGAVSNVIGFSLSVPNQYITNNIVSGVITILSGLPSSIAISVDNTNLGEATWTAYTSSNITVYIGTNQGVHDVWIGLRGRWVTSEQTWEETTLVLNALVPTIAITSPTNNAAFNASRVNVSGNFSAGALNQITINGIPAFVNGTSFEARNVPLAGGANILTAIVEDLTGMTNAASITVTGDTNPDGSLNDPVQLVATPVAGFAPLTVTFQITNNAAPGTLQQAFWDFNGDGITDFAANNTGLVAYTYTNGEYFPVVTLQTDVGRFSSIGGWNGYSLDSTNQPIRINVQMPATQTVVLSNFPNPVDLKWDGSHLYVLSGSGRAIYEFATNGSTIRSLSLPGGSPSGLDVDGMGNVYVAVTNKNQVWKLNPTEGSFVADTNFGFCGCIGSTNGNSGTGTNEFNQPYDLAVSPDGQTISVSDSGNHRIQQFSATSGAFRASFGSQGTEVGQFNAPKGLTYDAYGTLYIVDSGNNRIILAEGSTAMDAMGTGGNGLGQFTSPLNISVGKRGVYLADTGNGRIQKFDLPVQGLFEITSGNAGYALSTNLSSPAALAAVDNLTNEFFYVADTGNDRVLLCQIPDNNADEIMMVWNNMTNCAVQGDISGAMQYFYSVSVERFQQAFLAMGTANLIPIISQIGILMPVYIQNNNAEYYFQQTMAGQTIAFTVEFVKVNGVWKIVEF